MNRRVRIILSKMIYLIGIAVSVYIGGWVMVVRPVRSLVASYVLGELQLAQVVITAVKCLCSMTVSGFIWCIGYMASNYVFDLRDEIGAS